MVNSDPLWSPWCEKTPGRAQINRVFVKYINIHTNRTLLKAWVTRGCMNYDLQLVVITNQQQKSMTLTVVVLFWLLSPNSVTEIFLSILLNVVTLSWIYIDEVLPSAFRCLTTFSVPSFGEEKRGEKTLLKNHNWLLFNNKSQNAQLYIKYRITVNVMYFSLLRNKTFSVLPLHLVFLSINQLSWLCTGEMTRPSPAFPEKSFASVTLPVGDIPFTLYSDKLMINTQTNYAAVWEDGGGVIEGSWGRRSPVEFNPPRPPLMCVRACHTANLKHQASEGIRLKFNVVKSDGDCRWLSACVFVCQIVFNRYVHTIFPDGHLQIGALIGRIETRSSLPRSKRVGSEKDPKSEPFLMADIFV